jgi:hypothetical protein
MGIFALAFFIILFSHIPEPELEAEKAAAAEGKTQRRSQNSAEHFHSGISYSVSSPYSCMSALRSEFLTSLTFI